MKKHPIYLIAAVDEKMGIGLNGQLPWRIQKDLAFFQKITTKTESNLRQNMVIMGRSTWESIPKEHRPLTGRRNIVLSRNKDFKAQGAYVFHNMKESLEFADDFVETIYVIGGGKVFNEAMKLRNLKGIYLTHIHGNYKCDTHFPKLPRNFKPSALGKDEENGTGFEFKLYKK